MTRKVVTGKNLKKLSNFTTIVFACRFELLYGQKKKKKKKVLCPTGIQEMSKLQLAAGTSTIHQHWILYFQKKKEKKKCHVFPVESCLNQLFLINIKINLKP